MITIASVFLIFLVFAILTLFCVGAVRRYALARQLLDVPNERSLHTVPTSSGGGVAIVAISSIGFFLLAWWGVLDYSLAAVLVVGGLAVAGIGLADDRKGVSRLLRLIVHIGAAVWAVYLLDGTPALQIGSRLVELSGFWYPVSVVGIVWTLNLFNFMDGIDGIAASEAIFVALAGALLAFPMAVAAGVSVAAAVLAGSCLGFLVWNWPPAKIFMGDVGSGYLGYVLAVLALSAAVDNPVALLVWLVLGGVFFVDATATLVRRLARGERIYRPHRTHAYQWLARRWHSHRRVTAVVIAVNLVGLLPLAIWCTMQPDRAAYIVAGALVLLLVGVILADAGRAEDRVEG